MVLVSHFNLKRVKELVSARPSLAKAAWDWGFGDWETALGAASHMGNRQIAEYLLTNGAHPSIFSAAMLGHLDAVKGFVAAQPGIQRTIGPHSISLLEHAKAGGVTAKGVYEYLASLVNARRPP
ncbi:MAG: ankyrin repeat domain-containing protein, partial [Acidobacteria bacterium]|nr:ankyrin repeat domain-containing protein [Acidobacteriota bacterium]